MGAMQRRLQQLQLDSKNAEQQRQKAASQEAAERQSHQQALCLLQVMLIAPAGSADLCQSKHWS